MCLNTSLLAASSTFRDDAPTGFIHLTHPNLDQKLEPVDVFIPTNNIVEIKVESRNGDGGLFFIVQISTNGTTAGVTMSNSKFYVFEFKTKAEALKLAAKLMRITAKGEQD